MKNWIISLIANILALIIITLGFSVTKDPKHFQAATTPGIWSDSPTAILIAVVALGLANSVVRPIILFFAWPINCVTLGLFSWILNVVLFLVVGNLGLGFHVNGPIAALIGSVAMGVLSGAISFFLVDTGKKSE